MITDNDILHVICHKLNISCPEEYYEKMKKQKENNCKHDFQNDSYGDQMHKGWQTCIKCGKKIIIDYDGKILHEF